MIIKPPKRFGRRYPIRPHKGKLVETVVLKFPDLVFWMAEKNPPYGSEWLPDYIQKCVDLFEAKPLTKFCGGKVNGHNCTKTATRFALYPDSAQPTYWCATCDPYQLGSTQTLTISDSYYDALFHVWATTSRNRTSYRNLIKDLAEAKGLTGSLTEKKIIQFFYGADAKPVAPMVGDDDDV